MGAEGAVALGGGGGGLSVSYVAGPTELDVASESDSALGGDIAPKDVAQAAGPATMGKVACN